MACQRAQPFGIIFRGFCLYYGPLGRNLALRREQSRARRSALGLRGSRMCAWPSRRAGRRRLGCAGTPARPPSPGMPLTRPSLPVPSRPEMNRARNAYDANSLHAGVARPWTRVIPWRRCLRASRHLGDVLCGGNVSSAAESAVQVIIRLTAGTTRFPAPGVIGLSPFCECGPGNTCRQFSTPGHGEILRFFDGLELIEPAMVRIPVCGPTTPRPWTRSGSPDTGCR